jgi:hypothetical protein
MPTANHDPGWFIEPRRSGPWRDPARRTAAAGLLLLVVSSCRRGERKRERGRQPTNRGVALPAGLYTPSLDGKECRSRGELVPRGRPPPRSQPKYVKIQQREKEQRRQRKGNIFSPIDRGDRVAGRREKGSVWSSYGYELFPTLISLLPACADEKYLGSCVTVTRAGGAGAAMLARLEVAVPDPACREGTRYQYEERASDKGKEGDLFVN